MTDLQCTINTLNRNTLAQFRNYLQAVGTRSTVKTTTYNGIPFYLITANNNNSYVCTKAQWHFFSLLLPLNQLEPDATAFRVFPPLRNTAHKSKGAQFTIQYKNYTKNTAEAYNMVNTTLSLENAVYVP